MVELDPTLPAKELLRELSRQPGIRISKLRNADRVLVETINAIYELEVLDPSTGFVRASATDITLHKPTVCRFEQSTFGPDVSIRDWITQQMRMELKFKNATFVSTPAISARVDGKSADGRKWHYEVF
jgi:hypothetical protein